MPLHPTPLIINPPTDITIDIVIDYENPESLKTIGMQLWNALAIAEAFNRAYEQRGKNILPIVIESNDTKNLKLPWELLYHEKFGFLATHSSFTLSRKIPDVPFSESCVENRPLRVLFFSTLPDDLSASERLAVESEQVAVLESLMSEVKKGLIEIKIPNDGRFESLKSYIKENRPDLVFLSGHSGYENGVGSFLFEDKRGLKVNIDEEQLANAFDGSTVECVVLSSCESAKADTKGSGLAQALAFRGIKNVIGMSDSIYDKAGATFAKHFIKEIASQSSIAQALQKSREEIYKLDDKKASAHWFLPLLLSQDIYEPLVNWDFEPKPPTKEMTLQKLNQIVFKPLFIGRRKEFRVFYNKLYDNKLKKLLIFGEGGIGKSALVAHFGLELRREGYKLFDYSLKHGGDFEDFLLDIELELNEANAKKYAIIKERCQDEACKAKRLVKLLLEENRNVAFIFDNLESIQNDDTKVLEDETLKAWIEVLSQTDDVVLLMTSRWLLPDCKEFIQLGKPLKGDFLHYIASQNIDFSQKSKIDKVYETLGGNYRGTEFFVNATKGMSLEEEQFFLEKLSKATRDIQIDMAIEKILSYRSTQEIELLHRLSVYPVPVAKEGIEKIASDLPKEALDILVSFSLVEERYNGEYEVKEYQISALVLNFEQEKIELTHALSVLASEYQLWLFLNERTSLTQAMIAHEALRSVGEVEKLDAWLFDERNGKEIALRGLILGNLGYQYHQTAEYEKSLRYLEQSLTIRQAIGDKLGEGTMLNNIAMIYDAQGDLPTALTYLEQSLKIQQAIGDIAESCYTLFNMGHIYGQNDEHEEAVRAWVEVYSVAKQINLAEILNALESLAEQLGLENGLENWEMLAQRFKQ